MEDFYYAGGLSALLKALSPYLDTRCLTDNVALYTAWANDAERNDVFVNQMRGLLRPEDVVILISYGVFTEQEAARHAPRVVFVDERNRVVRTPLRAES